MRGSALARTRHKALCIEGSSIAQRSAFAVAVDTALASRAARSPPRRRAAASEENLSRMEAASAHDRAKALYTPAELGRENSGAPHCFMRLWRD